MCGAGEAIIIVQCQLRWTRHLGVGTTDISCLVTWPVGGRRSFALCMYHPPIKGLLIDMYTAVVNVKPAIILPSYGVFSGHGKLSLLPTTQQIAGPRRRICDSPVGENQEKRVTKLKPEK